MGISRQEIAKLHYNGYLERICQGYYQLSDKDDFSEEQLIATTIPKCIISLESALYHYNYSDFVPRKWSVTVPRNISRKLMNYPAAELYNFNRVMPLFPPNSTYIIIS